MDVYEKCPVINGKSFEMRQTVMGDCADLLKVYSDEQSFELFNGDNCHGDNFQYLTMERMAEAIAFWDASYRKKHFVRWSIIDRKISEAIGTIELFHRDAQDAFTNTGLLRIDLRSDYERAALIEEMLEMIVVPAYEWFECNSLTTKAVSSAGERRKALHRMGFEESQNTIKGHCGEWFGDYFVRFGNA